MVEPGVGGAILRRPFWFWEGTHMRTITRALLLLALALCTGTAVAEVKVPPIGTLVTEQTGTANSTDVLRIDNRLVACFEYNVTGACTVELEMRIGGPGASVFEDVVGSSFAADKVFCITSPLGEYRVVTSACAGTVTVRYHTGAAQ